MVSPCVRAGFLVPVVRPPYSPDGRFDLRKEPDTLATLILRAFPVHHHAQRRGGKGTPAPAWRDVQDQDRVAGLIRTHTAVDGGKLLGGVVEVDEIFIGGHTRRDRRDLAETEPKAPTRPWRRHLQVAASGRKLLR